MNGMNGTNGMNGNHANGTTLHGDEALAADHARMQTELVAAKERLEQARDRLAARDRALQDALRLELAEAQEMLAQLDRTHQSTIAKIHADAHATAERILAEARGAALATSDEAYHVQ